MCDAPEIEFDHCWSKIVSSSPALKEANPLKLLGLISDGQPDMHFDAAIRMLQSKQPGEIPYGFARKLTGTPDVADDTDLIDETVPYKFTCYEDCLQVGRNISLQRRIRSINSAIEDCKELRHWWNNYEYEDIITSMSGMYYCSEHCSENDYQIRIDETSMASSLSSKSNFPEIWFKLNNDVRISKPTWLFNGWTSPSIVKSKDDCDHNFKEAKVWGNGKPFKWLKIFDYWLTDTMSDRRKPKTGIEYLTPASLVTADDCAELTRDLYSSVQKYYVMLISTAQANLLRSCTTEFQQHEKELKEAFNSTITEFGYICKVNNLLIAEVKRPESDSEEGDRIPKFTVGERLFSRALVFCSKSMVIGYQLSQVMIKSKNDQNNNDSKPEWLKYICSMNSENNDLWLRSNAMYGSKVVQEYEKVDTHSDDIGRIAIDLLEQ